MKMPRSQILKIGVLLAIAGVLLYFTFREESTIRTIEWIPWSVGRFIEGHVYLRNLWGFLPLGFFLGWAYGIAPLPWKGGRVRWMALGLLVLPVLKELAQIPLPHRSCHPLGILAGVGGMVLGLGLGSLLRHAMEWLGKRRQEKENLKPEKGKIEG